MAKKKIVITGLGILSPIGIGLQQYWNGLRCGSYAFKQISLFDTAGLSVNMAGEVAGFDPKQILGPQFSRDWDRASLMLSSAVKFALKDSGIEVSNDNCRDIGISTGTTFGSLNSISEFDKEAVRDGPRYANPSVFTSTVGNCPSSRASIAFGLKGFNSTISTGMCSALDALDYGRDFLTLNKIKTVVVASVEALSPQIFLGFYKLNYLAGLKERSGFVSCPFDWRRNGVILSEGSVALTLEELDSAKKRKAKIYAQILGTGSSYDPLKSYRYDPKGKGMAAAMKQALRDSGLWPNNIDCIFANANSTPDADSIETKAIKEVFGKRSYKIPVTAIKSIIGETYSASGGMSLAAAVGALNQDFIPPTINLTEKDPDCDLDYVPNVSRAKLLSRIMVNTFGPSGENMSVIIGRVN